MAELQHAATPDSRRRGSTSGSLVGFFALTFVVTWTFFVLAVALSRGVPLDAPLRPGILALVYLGTFAPSMVALGLTARAEGRAGVSALLNRLFEWRVRARWYAFAASYTVVIRLTAALLHRLVAGAWPRFDFEHWFLMATATIFSTVIGGQAGEEIGWRGYALPRLAARFGLALASIMLGLIWASWHLPLFFLRGADTYGQSFPAYLLQVTALSVALAWLFWRTNGSLLLTMLMHAAINNTTGVVPSIARTPTNPFAPHASLLSWLTMALLWIPAAYLLVRMRTVKSMAGWEQAHTTTGDT